MPLLRNPMPLFFDAKKPIWPEPQLSIDRECPSIGGLRCWQVKGPALAAMNSLCSPIAQLLDKHRETLEQGEPKPRAVCFTMWMVGSTPQTAHPTIVFSSKSRRQRSYAKALLKESGLLDQYTGLRIKTLDKAPAIYQAGREVAESDFDYAFDDGVYMVDDSRGACGALISFGQAKRVTMGAVLLIDGFECGVSVQHARPDFPQETTSLTECTNLPCFDDDSDDESLDLVEITSRGRHQHCPLVPILY